MSIPVWAAELCRTSAIPVVQERPEEAETGSEPVSQEGLGSGGAGKRPAGLPEL